MDHDVCNVWLQAPFKTQNFTSNPFCSAIQSRSCIQLCKPWNSFLTLLGMSLTCLWRPISDYLISFVVQHVPIRSAIQSRSCIQLCRLPGILIGKIYCTSRVRYSNCQSGYCTSRSVANLTFISQNILRGLPKWFDWVTSFLTRYKYNLNWNIRNISYFIFLCNIDMITLRPWEELDFLLEIHIRFFVEKDVIMA